jgi:hypothetical protein
MARSKPTARKRRNAAPTHPSKTGVRVHFPLLATEKRSHKLFWRAGRFQFSRQGAGDTCLDGFAKGRC